MEKVGIFETNDSEIDKNVEKVCNPIYNLLNLDTKERHKYETQYLFTKESKNLFNIVVSSQIIKATRTMFMIRISEIFKFPNFLKYKNHDEIYDKVNLVCEEFGFKDFSYYIEEDMRFVFNYKAIGDGWKKRNFFQINSEKDKKYTFAFYISQDSSYDIYYVNKLIFLNYRLFYDYFRNIDWLITYNKDLRKELENYFIDMSKKLKEYEIYLKTL